MNKAILIGRLTADPELKQTSGGTSVTRFTLAVSRRFVKEGGQEADFINCTAWGKTAEFVSKYFRKGQKMATVGRIEVTSWQDDKSEKHYNTSVTVEEVEFCEKKSEAAQTNTTNAEKDEFEAMGFAELDDTLPWN